MSTPAPSRALIGAFAGIVGTAAMTAAMSRLHRRLPEDERYPLPPRLVMERLRPRGGEQFERDKTAFAHFAFGAAAGALLAVAAPRPKTAPAIAYAVGVWAASYQLCFPAAKILPPASQHPARRNLLMVAVHFVWGSVTAWTIRELTSSRPAFSRNNGVINS